VDGAGRNVHRVQVNWEWGGNASLILRTTRLGVVSEASVPVRPVGLQSAAEDDAMRDRWHQLWATFSVKDHTSPGAFVAEALLYDHLLIPVVPTRRDGLSTDDAQEEWKRWKDNGWDPARLNQLVAILGERATAIPWTNELQNEWRERMGTSKEPSVAPVTEEVERARVHGYAMTGTVLARFAPKMAKTVVAVSHHRSLDDLESAMPVRRADPSAGLPAATLLAVVGHELLVPEDPDRDDFQLLAEAADVGGDAAYREKRKLLHLWQQEFLDSDNLTDARSIKQAVEHMSDLVQDLNAATGKSKVWKGFKTLFSFLRRPIQIIAPV
jgi:hypothetical protein